MIVAAGRGERLGSPTPKCLIRVEGISLLLMAAWPFEKAVGIEAIILVVPPGSEDAVRIEVESTGLGGVKAIVPGGARRQDSVLAGLKALSPEIDRVLVHDGARPLLSVELVNRLVNALRSAPAVTAAIPAADTIHRDDAGCAAAGPERADLVMAQTPQGFERKLLMQTFEKAGREALTATDEVTLVREMTGVKARLITGEAGNIKITSPDDLGFYHPQLQARAEEMRRE